MDGIDLKTLPNLDLKEVALNKDLGKLNFEAIYPKLEELKELFIELDQLDYKAKLTENETANINNAFNQFIEYVRSLRAFDIGQANSQEARDNLQATISNYYNSTLQNLRPYLTYLRQEAANKSELKQQVKEASEARKEYQALSEQARRQIEEFSKQISVFDKSNQKVAAGKLAKHFSTEALNNSAQAKVWLEKRDFIFRILTIIISINLISFFLLLIFGNLLNVFSVKTTDIFTIDYLLVKIALITLLTYALVFNSKNYNINSNLAALNRHRMNVADTMENFLALDIQDSDRSQIIKTASDAMFKHLPNGYVGKSEAQGTSPVHEIINTIIPKAS